MSYEKISKYMSMILRHRPETIGITLDEHGWADVDELIEGIAAKKKFNREILEEIVRTDKKQRYYHSTPEMLKKYAEMVPPVDEQK